MCFFRPSWIFIMSKLLEEPLMLNCICKKLAISNLELKTFYKKIVVIITIILVLLFYYFFHFYF